jgi:hypothetical protein
LGGAGALAMGGAIGLAEVRSRKRRKKPRWTLWELIV